METEVELRGRARWLFERAAEMRRTGYELNVASLRVRRLLVQLRHAFQPTVWQGRAAEERSEQLDRHIDNARDLANHMESKAFRLWQRADHFEDLAHTALLRAEQLAYLEANAA